MIAILWLVFSLVYILYDIWSDFKTKELNQAYQQAYQQGKVDTINALIQQAKSCQQVPIYSGDTQIQIIDTSCLKAQTTGNK